MARKQHQVRIPNHHDCSNNLHLTRKKSNDTNTSANEGEKNVREKEEDYKGYDEGFKHDDRTIYEFHSTLQPASAETD